MLKFLHQFLQVNFHVNQLEKQKEWLVWRGTYHYQKVHHGIALCSHPGMHINRVLHFCSNSRVHAI
jgi:hypothetical protein